METNTTEPLYEPLPQPIATPVVGTPLLSRLNAQEGASGDVYKVLRDHQQGASEELRFLHAYLQPIIKRFFGDLPQPALSYGPSHWRTLAWYMEKDGLALEHRINLNSLHAERPLAEILRSLAHELCHCYQHVYGTPPKPSSVRDHNYHNAEFRRKVQEIGIPCNKRGVSLGLQEPFVGFLKELVIEADTFPFKQEPDETPTDGSTGAVSRPGSRLKPWACKCPRARVWASVKVELSAICRKCRSPFQRQ